MFDIDELMFQYESLCHSVNEAAKQQGIMIPLAAQQSLNTALDGCIARTVTEWEQEKRKSRGTSAVPRLRFVANEIRTALHNAGLGFQAVRSGRVPARGATADAIERSLARLGTLTENLLTEVRIAERLQAKEARLPIQKLLDESLSRISADAGEKEIGISVETDRSLEIEGDPDLLITALTNLLQNAVKFTRPGGSVSVRANAKPQGQVVIEIEGACAGLPADVVRRPFISFAHTGPHPSGLGLSLVMAHQVVDAHGGAIEVKDLPGRGCVFVVEMPSSAPARELPV